MFLLRARLPVAGADLHSGGSRKVNGERHAPAQAWRTVPAGP